MLLWLVVQLAIAAAAASLGWPGPAAASGQNPVQPASVWSAGSCLSCHDGARRSGMKTHLEELRRSVHVKPKTDCTDCHGGDSSKKTAATAHPVHFRGSDPLSATNGKNLHTTCGRCHQQIGSLFTQSSHFAMLQRGERMTPTCTTCHGEVAADLPPAAQIQRICNECHGAGTASEHPEYGRRLRLALLHQELSKRAQDEIRVIVESSPAGAARDALLMELAQVGVATTAASISGHGGRDSETAALLEIVRQSVVKLLSRVEAFLAPAPKPAGVIVRQINYSPDADQGQTSASCGPSAKPANLAFVVKDMNDRDVRFADFKGKLVLLNFWATWCGPCKAEIPWFVELQTKYGATGLQVLGFSVDDTPDKLKPYAAQYKINYPLLQGLGHDDVQEAYGPIWGVPMTFLISRDSRVCRTYRGIPSKDQIERDVKALL